MLGDDVKSEDLPYEAYSS